MAEEIKVEVPTENKDEFIRVVKTLADKMNKAYEDNNKKPILKRLIR